VTAPWLVWDNPEALAAFQGIRYVSLTLLPTPQAPTHAELVLHLLDTWTPLFTPASLSIVDGEGRAVPFTLVPQSGATITLDLQPLPDQFHAHAGVAVTLLDGGDKRLDAFFASSTFLLTIDCERGDCRPLLERPPRVRKERPAVDLLTKDYAGFVAMLSDWARVKNPAMADLAPAALERVLLELLAHQGDMQSYLQDRVANEAFVDTASQRHALRQHATLLGTHLFDGSAAETWLAFTASTDGYVPKDIEVTTAEGLTDADVVFFVASRTRVLQGHSLLKLAAWPGANTAVVPAGASEVLLWGAVENLRPRQRLAFVQGLVSGVVPFSQVVAITKITPMALPGWVETPNLPPAPGNVDVTLVAFDPPLFAPITPWDAARPLAVYGNIARARFGGKRRLVLDLRERDLAGDRQSHTLEVRAEPDGSVTRLLRATRLPEEPVVFEKQPDVPGRAPSTPMVAVTIDDELWESKEHFHNSRSYDRHYVATADEDGSLWLQFGDGKNGMLARVVTKEEEEPPLLKSPVKLDVTYRVGDPVAGNIGVGVLVRFVPGQTGLTDLVDLKVVNVAPGRGGKRPEKKDAARLRIPATIKNGPLERAVTLADYAAAARGVPGVARAAAKSIGGPFSTVLMLVDPEGRADLDPALQEAVYERVDLYRMAGREHVVRPPAYVPIEVKLALCAEPGTLRHRVRDAVLAALRPGTDEAPGFFHPDRLTFGEDLDLGDLLAFVQGIAGVRSVKALRFRKLFVPDSGPVDRRIGLGPTEVLRLDADDDRPENGKLSVLVVGLDPSVKETDFVIEETP
jgi:hypothetical protein